MSFSAPFYVECQDVYPDDWLDLFGISDNLVDSTAILEAPSAGSSNLIPNDYTFQRHHSREPHLRPFSSELLSSICLRC